MPVHKTQLFYPLVREWKVATNIQWFDGDAEPKLVDVVHQWECTLFKIWIVLKNCYQFILFFSFRFAQKQGFSKLIVLNWKMEVFEI